MTMTPYEPRGEVALAADVTPGRDLIEWAQALSSAHHMATALCKTAFVPKHFIGKPDEAAAALMLGSELGLSPISALRSIYVISGTPGLYAKAMVAVAQSRGHDVWTEKSTDTEVVVCGRRKGSEIVERVAWTIERARRAGYTSNKKYETDPQAMLYARAAGDVVRRIAADALAGIPHSVEELELEETPKTTRKVSRAKADQPPAPPEPDPTPAPVIDEMVTKPQLTKMHACLTDLGVTDRDSGLAIIGDYAGRVVESSKDLTKAEASQVIEKLQADVNAQGTPEPTLDAEVVDGE